MAEEDRLKTYWEHFFKAETGTYEKSTWLDLFLAEFLIRLKEGVDPRELINFCPVSGVVSLVGCELLCGIHRVTSSQRSQCRPGQPGPLASLPLPITTECSATATITPDDDDDGDGTTGPSSPKVTALQPSEVRHASLFSWANSQPASDILRQYLLGGVAWRCLMLLRALGVEGLSCCRQLSSVLIWLYGETAGGGQEGALQDTAAASAFPRPPRPPRTPIHLLFSHRIWSKRNSAAHTQNSSSERSSLTGRFRQSNSETKSKRKAVKHSDHSSDSGDSNGDLQILNRTLTIKVCTPEDFQYFDSPGKTSSDYPETLYTDPYHSPKKPKPKADDFINEKHKEVINTQITSFEFTSLIIELLQELCKTESSLSGSEGSQISVQCINFSLRNLCSLQFSSNPQSVQYNSEEVSTMKVLLTELLIVSLDKVLVHSDLCAKLINNGILPMLLRILEDVICKSSSKYKERAKDNIETPSKAEADNMLRFVFGIGYSITAFFHCLLVQCRTVDKLREFTDQFKLYGECVKGGLLKDCIELMVRIPEVDQTEVVVLIKMLIESLGKLINGMKRVRSEVVHSAACPRTRHKVCRQRVTAGMHHHHEILGEAGTGLPLSSACCISVLYGTLTSLVCDEEVSAITAVRNKILRVMLNSGVCCCFSPGFLMESIVRLMLTHNSVANLCLQLLEHTVYGELGASVIMAKLTDQLPCSVCEPTDDKRNFVRKYCPHGVSPVDRKSVWSFLIHYNSLLQLDNHNNVLHATVSHLLRITPKCRSQMKYELLFSVIYPTFIVAKHRYMIRLEESAYFLTVSCLNIFASLLNTVTFAEQFIQKGGLSYVLELVSFSEFSNQCCSILEIAIIVEIFKLIKENADITFYREINSLLSVQMLLKSLSEMTDKFYKIYKLKLPNDVFEESCDISKERESLAVTVTRRSEPSRKSSMPKSITVKQPTSFAFGENVQEDAVEDFIEVLKTIWTFWKTCASVCMYSPMFRQFVVTESVFEDSFAMLKLLLYQLCHRDISPAELKISIKILEALLTVQFAVADVTSGRSKETSCSVIRASLSADQGALFREGGAALRALCEALIRVCVAGPSATHAMPRAAAAKVPPLECASGGSSAECSSSEESAGRVYSEHSEAGNAADGYEADVEFAKSEMLAAINNNKISASLSTIDAINGDSQWPSDEDVCAEYVRGADLAHPELCAIVVDILAQLIHKVMSSPEQSHPQQCVALASLARAVCGRLGCKGGASLLPRLLPAAAPLLVSTQAQLAEVQSSVLELVVLIGSGGVEPECLWQLLRALATSRPAVGQVLAVLHRLAGLAQPLTPLHIVTFPIDTTATDNDVSPEALNYVMVNNSSSSQSQQAESRASALHAAHTRAGIRSPWAVCGARCGIDGIGWGAWHSGMGIVMWIRPDRGNGNDNGDGDDAGERDCAESPSPPRDNAVPRTAKRESSTPSRHTDLLHVLSVGHDSLMFEMWLDANTGCLTFRLSRPETASYRVVSTVQAAGPEPGRTSCVAIGVREALMRRRNHIQVTVFVNGCETDTVLLPVQGILVRKAMPLHVLLGQCSLVGSGTGTVGGYHLSQFSLLRAPILTPVTAMALAAVGPDHCCQLSCECPNWSPLLTPTALSTVGQWDHVFDQSQDSLRELRDSLLLSFAAHSPLILNLYHQTTAITNVFSPLLAQPPTGTGSSIPEALPLLWRASPQPHCSRALPTAVYMLGGPDVMLFLFARVVELEAPAVEQAMALSILLQLCRADNRLYSQLYADDSLDMLLTVFASPKCQMSTHLIKAIVDDACSCSAMVWSGTGTGVGVVVRVRDGPVLREPRLLLLLTSAWRQLDTKQLVSWEVESSPGCRTPYQGSLWALTLCCINALVGDDVDHDVRAFNHYQMTRVGLMRHLLTACKERFLNSESGPLDPVASRLLVRLVRALMGVPPLLDRLAMLCDFLLLMHQASDTFVTHSRANFYFLLTADTADTSEYRRNSFTRRHSKRRKKPKDPDMASSSSVTSEDINENLLKDLTLDDKLDQSSVESTKQMKGIINMQIKEGRRYNVSSTSENSDILNDKPETISEGSVGAKEEPISGQGEGEGGPAAADANDVMYSNVYQQRQRRVLSGAEPGWSACEGLLRLVTDSVSAMGDRGAAQAVQGAVNPETLVVLANHSMGGVRAAVVRAVSAIVRRAPAELSRRLRTSYYFCHLANQISLYRGCWELAAACAELVTGCELSLEDQCDDALWQEVGEESLVRSSPLVALLPTCLHDVPLAHNLMLLIRRVIDKAPLKLISELSIAEVVVRCVAAMGAAGDGEGAELLQGDLHGLLCRIAAKAGGATHGGQTIVDIHHMLTHGAHSAASRGAALSCRAAQLSLLTSQLDQLEERLHCSYAAQTQYANYFTTVLSSAVSLGSESVARGERADLAARHLATVSRAVSFLIAPSDHRDPELEGVLLDRLLHTLLPAVCDGVSPARPKWWVMGGADWAATLLELFWWAVSPAPGARPLQPRLLTALYHATQPALAVLAPTDPPTMRKLAVYLLSLIQHVHATSEEGEPTVELAITDWARGWAVSTQAGLNERLASNCLADEAARLLAIDQERWAKAAHKQRTSIAKVVFAKDALANKLMESAMGITRQVVDIQNGERKAFMEHLRRAHSEAVAATQRWQRLVDTHTHEEAVWHDPVSYPQSWQLDPTEGPGRVRVRLRRAHLNIHPRFLKPEHRHKAERVHGGPLSSVVGVASELRGGLVARLRLHETVSYMARVTHVTVNSETPGELLLSDRCIHFVPEECEEDVSGVKKSVSKDCSCALSWPLEAVVRVCSRRWCLQERAAELFLSSGHAQLVAFADVAERTAFLKALDRCHLPNRTEPDTLSEAMSQWRSGCITNWEYLMRLNGLAGRSYNDLMQYPVLPFVIADYSSRILDLTDPASFRDLSRPMAVQDKTREQHYINTYNDLALSRREGCSPLLSPQCPPHHYSSLYSNSGGVLHYLVRLPPFTDLFLQYQDNNFDMPDRTFHSLATTWRLITKDSPTDVKELIPELFYLPELFHNNEGLNLGIRQCGAAVDTVELPPWAADARLFTLAHRQALEAATVTEALPHWIDLVFGYKQTGQAAIDAINVFPACTYYGFDPLSLPDALDRQAAADMVRSYGQAPRQLLRQPHPQRAADLSAALTQPRAYDGVCGVVWGRYAGSPALPPPTVTALTAVSGRRPHPSPAPVRLQPLPHPRTVAINTLNTALLPLTGQSGSPSSVGGSVGAVGVLSWGHSDGVVRIKRRRDLPPEPLLHVPPLHQITVVSSCVSLGWSCPAVVGLSSGAVLALRLRHDALGPGPGASPSAGPAVAQLPARARVRPLLAHRAPVTAIAIAVRAGLIATASADGKIVVWDLNRLSYIRTLPNRDSLPVSHVAISETLGDVASVHEPARDGDSGAYETDRDSKYQSLIRVHTVNARYVGSVKVPELVTCICYSNAPEGVSVNVIAVGTRAGGVRLYSGWELRPAGTLTGGTLPLLSLAYSSDSSVLFGCYADGACVAWESETGRGTPRLIPAHALL